MNETKNNIIKITIMSLSVGLLILLIMYIDKIIFRIHGVPLTALPHYLKIAYCTFTLVPLLFLPLYTEGIIEVLQKGDVTLSYKECVKKRGPFIANMIAAYGVIGQYLLAVLLASTVITIMLCVIVYLFVGWDYIGKTYMSMYPLTQISISVFIFIFGILVATK
ncbi:MAG: hypothetical protein ACRC92_26630 [Peptostreptococcaceae bacterium]